MFLIFVEVQNEIVPFFAEKPQPVDAPGEFKPNTEDDLIFTLIHIYYLESRVCSFPFTYSILWLQQTLVS